MWLPLSIYIRETLLVLKQLMLWVGTKMESKDRLVEIH